MLVPGDWVAVGIDNGGTTNNGTVLTSDGRFLVDTMAELPSLVREGPDKAIQALVDEFDKVLGMTGVPREKVLAVGLDTPGPAIATGDLGRAERPTLGASEWHGFDFRCTVEERSASRWSTTTRQRRRPLRPSQHISARRRPRASSVAAIVGTGLGGGVIEAGRVVGRRRDGRRARARPHPDARAAGRRASRYRRATAVCGDVESVAP